jgi:hypothetical protein
MNNQLEVVNESAGAVNERAARIALRAKSPQQKIMEYFQTKDFAPDIEEHRKFVREVMLNNPFATYMEFRKRLELGGADADFPEFKGVISYLTKFLFQTPELKEFFMIPQNNILLQQLTNKLLAIQIEGRFNYPYRSTIYCIESLLELIDLYYRSVPEPTAPTPPPAAASAAAPAALDPASERNVGTSLANEKIGPYYHIFRYRSYMTTFTDSDYGIPKNIIFPTFVSIGSLDLIKIRCVPILIMGVVDRPIYIDQYINTPLDFWAHDIQHSKRQIQETERYFDEFIKHNRYYTRRTLFDVKTDIDFYKYMEEFTKKTILPLLTIKSTDDEQTKAFRALMKIIIFEVVHEKAWPITQKSLCKIIPMRYDEFPVENLDVIDGKIQAFHYLFADPTTIGNVVGKLRNGFYDKVNEVNERIVPKSFRTSKNVAIAATTILETIGCTEIPSIGYMIALAKDRHAMQEYLDMPTINIANEPVENVSYPDINASELFNDSELYPTFKPVAGISNTAKQNSLHKLRVVESNSNWMEGTRKKRGGARKKRQTRSKKSVSRRRKSRS